MRFVTIVAIALTLGLAVSRTAPSADPAAPRAAAVPAPLGPAFAPAGLDVLLRPGW